MHTEDQNSGKLDSLLTAYRDACPDPEASPEFMPNLWRKIEARRIDTAPIFKRFAHACMAATVALLLLSTVLMPTQDDEPLYSSTTYADVLAADHADEAYTQMLPADVLGDVR